MESGGWARLARTVMGRPVLFLTAGTLLLVAAALPMLALERHPDRSRRFRDRPSPCAATSCCGTTSGRGGITPVYAVVDGGGRVAAREPRVRRATERLVDLVFRDEETKVVASGTDERHIDPTGRYARHGRGTPRVRREADATLRPATAPRACPPRELSRRHSSGRGRSPGRRGSTSRTVPTAPFPGSSARSSRSRTSSSCVRFCLLLLPLKAVLLNLLSVAAAYGLLVVIFRLGRRRRPVRSSPL